MTDENVSKYIRFDHACANTWNASNQQLERCPFCPHGVGFVRNESGRYNGIVWVECDWPSHAVRLVAGEDAAPPCGARTAEYQTEEEAVAAWNSRVSAGGVVATEDDDDQPQSHAKTCDRWVQCGDHVHYEPIVNCSCAAATASPKEETLRDPKARSSRHPHFTHADHERMKATLDALSDCPTEEEAEAVLEAFGTSGKEVVNEFIERLLKENLELRAKIENHKSDL